MAKKKKQAASRKVTSSEKQVRTSSQQQDSNNLSPTWQLGIMDLEHPLWGLDSETFYKKILPRLRDLEATTWKVILLADGGRSSGRGKNSHPVDVEKLCREAQKRLEEIKQDDISQLFSLRLSGGERIYGIRERRTLRLIWYDPHHKDKKRAVYPVK